MALKPDRVLYITTMDYQCDAAASAGAMLVKTTTQPSGHGVAPGINESAPVATLPGTGTPASGTKPLGVLLYGVVNFYNYPLLADGSNASGLAAGIGDPVLMRQHRNQYKTEQVVGENVLLLKDGVVYTDQIVGTPAGEDDAYLGASGKFDTTQRNSIPAVGKFKTSKDTDGYAKVAIKIV